METESEEKPSEAQEDNASTLLPMLVGGLVLVVVGAVIVMSFV